MIHQYPLINILYFTPLWYNQTKAMTLATKFELKSEGIPLTCAIFTPEYTGPFPGLIICHGMPANPLSSPSNQKESHNELDYPTLVELCASEGFACVIFNFRGTGESGGNFHPLGWVHDLETILDWTIKNPLVDPNRVTVLGSSLGAAISIYVTAHHREIAGLIAFASPAMLQPRKEPAKAVEQFRKLGIIRNPEFPSSLRLWNQEYSEINPSDHIGNIATRHLLILQGETDEVVSPHNAQVLFDAAKEPKEITLLPGVSHRFRHEPLAITTALEWLKRNFIT